MNRTSTFHDSHEIIGNRIRDKREQWNMTQQQVAETIDVTLNYLGEIERGRRPLTLHVAESLCQLFGVTYDFLFLGIETTQSGCIADTATAAPHTARTALLDIVYSLSDEECEDYLTLLRDIRMIHTKAEKKAN